MATKDYAYAVTQILDPEKNLFSDRVISRDECFDPHSKAPRLKYVNDIEIEEGPYVSPP